MVCLPLFALAIALSVSNATVPDTIPEVTVIAPKPPDPDQLKGDNVPKYIAQHGHASVLTQQLGRWFTEVCPLTVGLTPGMNDFVTSRMQSIAASVGAPHDWSAKCRPNVMVYFTADPQKLMDEVVKREPQLLGFHYPHQTKRLATVDRPIQAWYVTALRGAAGPDEIESIWGDIPAGRLGSRLAKHTSSLIVFVLVVADTRKLGVLSIGAISDYIAMLTLSRPVSLEGCEPLPSIIDLLSPACGTSSPPTGLTAGDVAYLHALYSLDMEQPLSLQREDLRNKMMQAFHRESH